MISNSTQRVSVTYQWLLKQLSIFFSCSCPSLQVRLHLFSSIALNHHSIIVRNFIISIPTSISKLIKLFNIVHFMLEYLTLFLIITLYSNFFLISVGGNLLVVNGQVIISNLAHTTISRNIIIDLNLTDDKRLIYAC